MNKIKYEKHPQVECPVCKNTVRITIDESMYSHGYTKYNRFDGCAGSNMPPTWTIEEITEYRESLRKLITNDE